MILTHLNDGAMHIGLSSLHKGQHDPNVRGTRCRLGQCIIDVGSCTCKAWHHMQQESMKFVRYASIADAHAFTVYLLALLSVEPKERPQVQQGVDRWGTLPLCCSLLNVS